MTRLAKIAPVDSSTWAAPAASAGPAPYWLQVASGRWPRYDAPHDEFTPRPHLDHSTPPYYLPRVAIRAGVLMVVLCLLADVAVAGRWVVDEGGRCVREWTPSSIARGPLAMVNALTLPGRQLVGGGQAAYRYPSRSTGARILLVPTLSLLGFGTGAGECLVVMGLGVTDFLTGGAFDLVPDERANMSLAPMTPPFLEGIRQTPTTDPCGRRR